MSTESTVFSDIVSYMISATISIIISVMSFLYTRHYVISTSRRRTIRAIFRVAKIKGENNSISLYELYEFISLFGLLKLLLYFLIYSFLVSIFIVDYSSIFIPILPFLYILFYLLYSRFFNEVFARVARVLYKQSIVYEIVKDSLDFYDPNFSKLYFSFLLLVFYVFIQYKLYLDIILSTIFLLYEIVLVTFFLILIPKLLSFNLISYKSDLMSAIFMFSRVIIKAKVHTSKDSLEGIIIDIRDEFVLYNEGRKIYVPWDNILYFEIVEIEEKGNRAEGSNANS